MNPVLLVRGGALGDFVVTLPIIEALRRRFSRVHVLVNRLFVELLPEGVQASGSLDQAQFAPLFSRQESLPVNLREEFSEYRTVLSYLHDPEKTFENNVRDAGVRSFIAGVHTMASGAHATEQLAAPLRRLGIFGLDPAPRISVSMDEQTAAWSQLGLDQPSQNTRAIAIHPGSGSARKNWPLENWITLLQYALRRPLRILVVGGEADLEQIAIVRQKFGSRLTYAVGWPLRNLAALLAKTIFLGHDSGISHLAAATGAPSTILFGPSDPLVWAPQNANARVLTAPRGNLTQLPLATVQAALDQELMRIGIST